MLIPSPLSCSRKACIIPCIATNVHSFGYTFRRQAVSALTKSFANKMLFSHNSFAVCTSATGAQHRETQKVPFSEQQLVRPCPSARGTSSGGMLFITTPVPLRCLIVHAIVQKCKCFFKIFSSVNRLYPLKEIPNLVDSTHKCKHELKCAKSFSNRSSALSKFGSFRISFLPFSARCSAIA